MAGVRSRAHGGDRGGGFLKGKKNGTRTADEDRVG